MLKLILLARLLWLNPVEFVALKYAGCDVLLVDAGPETVAVKWVCPQ